MKWYLTFIAALALHSPAAAQEGDLAPLIDAMGGGDCADGDLTCVTMMMPRNHFANDPDVSLPITFAVSLATEPSKGTLIYVVGGPGGSGLQVADGYLAAMDESLVAQMNIVFFDQRGVGPDHGFSCLDAQVALDTAEMSVANPDAAIAIAQTYVTDCIAQIEDKALLAYLGTDQAIRDIEAFRQAIGAPKVWVYGESYGTQFAQEYATAFPDAISGVIVDGTVDLNLSFAQFYRSYTAASENILARVLAECDVIPACRDDMQGSATDAYDRLAARIDTGPVAVDFPLAAGGTEQRFLTAAMLENNAFYALYGPSGRAAFLRSLAAAERGDLLPMMRLGYATFTMNSETQEGVFDPGYSPAGYYAINCADYAEAEGDPAATALAIMAEAAEYAKTNPRLLRTYFSERLVCALWPHRGAVQRPEPFAGGDYPTLVLNSDTDPITPAAQAYAVFDNVRNGHMVLMQGGPHVILGLGLACPDRIVSNLVLGGVAPDAPLQLCEQEFLEGYVPLTLTDPMASADPLAVARAVETELLEYPELTDWDAEGSVSVACDHGGSVTETAAPASYDYVFAACALWPGLVVDGTGTEVLLDEGADGITLALRASGAHSGDLTYRHNYTTEAVSLSGTYDGKAVATPRPAP